MKRTIYLATVILLAACIMTGCKKENGRVFRLEIKQNGGDDKTSLGTGNTTVWTVGDIIYINGDDAVHQATVQSNNTAVFDPEVTAIGGNFYAFYAGKATNVSFDRTNKAFTYTLPQQFTYSESVLNAPLAGVCDAEADHIVFNNLCAMLKLTFVLPPQSVTITSSTPLSGTFTATYDATEESWTTTATSEPSDADYTLTINPSNCTVVYVPLPASNSAQNLTIRWLKANGKYSEISTGNTDATAVTLQASHIYPQTCAYAFTVSDNGDQIYFAPGNLQYINANGENEWRFSDHQYDFLGSTDQGGSNIHTVYVNRDLFSHISSGLSYEGYGPYYPYDNFQSSWGHVDISSAPYNALDWGNNTITNNVGNYSWRTPTLWEWKYLIGHKTTANGTTMTTSTGNYPANPRLGSGFGMATVHGQRGLVIFPDGYTCPKSNNTEWVNIGWHTATTYSNWYTLTDDQWETLEANGCVFLPATGYTTDPDGTNTIGTWYGENERLCYISANYLTGAQNSSANGTYATNYGTAGHLVMYGRLSSLSLYANNTNDRGALRLVRNADITPTPQTK